MAEFIPYVSTAISGAHYSNGALSVQWHSGTVTTFIGVPEPVWMRFQASTSKGRFISEHLKGKYREA